MRSLREQARPRRAPSASALSAHCDHNRSRLTRPVGRIPQPPAGFSFPGFVAFEALRGFRLGADVSAVAGAGGRRTITAGSVARSPPRVNHFGASHADPPRVPRPLRRRRRRCSPPRRSPPPTPEPLFKISLAQWSLHRAFFGQQEVEKLDPLKFAEIAKKDYGIDAVEYVNQFFKDKKNGRGVPEGPEEGRRRQRRQERPDHVRRRGQPRRPRREEAAQGRSRTTTGGSSAAKFLGCHSIRVNAAATGSSGYDEQIRSSPPTACAS